MTTDKQAVKAIAEAIVKASKTITDANNRNYVDNRLNNFKGGTGTGGSGGTISGTIPASQVTGLRNAVANYIGTAQSQAQQGDTVARYLLDALSGISGPQVSQAISQATFTSQQISDLTAGVAAIINLTTGTTIEDATIRQLKADIANVGLSNIGTADINYANIKDLTAGTAIFTEAVSNKLYIDRLAVTDANMLSLTAGEIMLKNTNGQFVRLVVDATTGEVSGEPVTFDGDDVFNDNSLNAEKLIENSITARELNVSSIFADQALIGAIKAQNIDVNDLFANNAFLSNIYTSSISAINDENCDISDNATIKLLNNTISLVVGEGSTSSSLVLTQGMIDAVSDIISLSADTIDLSANTSIDTRVRTVIEDEIIYQMTMVSTADILSSQVQSITLSAKLFRGKGDITSITSADSFIWKRISSNAYADALWNNNHSTGSKTLTITSSDVPNNATFVCEYIETGTVLASVSKGIIDYTDGEVLSVSIGQNLPVTQVYDSNEQEYSPDWSDDELVLTPSILNGGNVVQLGDQNVSVTWKRKVGSGSESDLITGETVTDKCLHVSANVLGSVTSGMLTYVAHVSYLRSGSTATAQDEKTFTLVKAGRDADVKSVQIQGEQVFKYSNTGALISSDTIHLEAITQSCTVAGWYYKSSNGIWIEYPSNLDNTTASDDELYVHDTDSVFNDDVAVIKVATNDNNVYDIFSIYKVYNGSKGDKGDTGEGTPAPTVFLTNENITFSGDKNGVVKPTAINCNVIAYIGTTKVKPVIGTISGAPQGMTITTSDAGNNEISIILSIGQNATLGGPEEQFGALTIQISSPVSTNLSITWSKVNTGADGDAGQSAVVFDLYAPRGTFFVNGEGDLLIESSAYDGSEKITTQQASYSWQKYVSGSWVNVQGATTESLIVNGTDVEGHATYRCSMVYNNITYYATITLVDKTDNYQAVIESSGGNIFKNSIGSSDLKCRIFQNGEEVDSTGVRYTCWWYKLDKDGNPENWNQYDASGNPVGEGVVRKAGKSITVTDKDVDEKATFICEVEDQAVQSQDERIITSANYTIVDINDPVQAGDEPTNPTIGMLWIDTSVEPNQLKRWNGEAWVSVSDVDVPVLNSIITTLQTDISQQQGEIQLRATKEEVEQIDDRVTSAETQIAEIDVRYDGIALAVARKATNYRQTTRPEDGNVGDIWVQPITSGPLAGTEKTYQAVGVNTATVEFAYSDDGEILYKYDDTEDEYDITVDENDNIAFDAPGDYIVNADGTLTVNVGWKEVIGDGVAALAIDVNGIQSTVADLSGNISVVSQKADRIDWVIKSGTSQSNMKLTDEMLGVIANDIDLQANNTIKITSAKQITAEAASAIDLSSNDTIRITSANQISASAANVLDLSSNNTIKITSANQISIDALNSIDLSTNRAILTLTDNVSTVQTIAENAVSQTKGAVVVDDVGIHIGRAVLDENGEYVRDDEGNITYTTNQVVVTDRAVNIEQRGSVFSSFASNYVQFGNYQLRQSSDGGLVFKLKDG